MPYRVLVASTSAYRREWYTEQLTPHEMEVFSSTDGLDCIAQMRARRPDVVLLETSLLWGGSQGVLALRTDERLLNETPVVLVDVDGASSNEWYQCAQYPVQGLILRRPSEQVLIATILSAIQRANSWSKNCPELVCGDSI